METKAHAFERLRIGKVTRSNRWALDQLDSLFMGWLTAIKVELISHVHEKTPDFFVFGKTLQDAPIDEPTADRHYLGCEPDIFINWQIVDDVSFALRYGLFFPGDAIPAGDQNHVRQFLYAAVTYAF